MRVWMREERQRRPHTQKASHGWNKSGGWLVTSVMQHADIFIIRPPVGGIRRVPVRDLTPAVAQTIIYPLHPPPLPEYTFILGVRSDRWMLPRDPPHHHHPPQALPHLENCHQCSGTAHADHRGPPLLSTPAGASCQPAPPLKLTCIRAYVLM